MKYFLLVLSFTMFVYYSALNMERISGEHSFVFWDLIANGGWLFVFITTLYELGILERLKI